MLIQSVINRIRQVWKPEKTISGYSHPEVTFQTWAVAIRKGDIGDFQRSYHPQGDTVCSQITTDTRFAAQQLSNIRKAIGSGRFSWTNSVIVGDPDSPKEKWHHIVLREGRIRGAFTMVFGIHGETNPASASHPERNGQAIHNEPACWRIKTFTLQSPK